MTVLRSVFAMIEGTIYSSRHGVPLILQTIFSCVRLLLGYFDCTTIVVADSLGILQNANQIGVPPLAVDSKELLHIAKEMALMSKNVHAKYKVLGVPSFCNSTKKIVSVWSR